jgi:hypothetical protein
MQFGVRQAAAEAPSIQSSITSQPLAATAAGEPASLGLAGMIEVAHGRGCCGHSRELEGDALQAPCIGPAVPSFPALTQVGVWSGAAVKPQPPKTAAGGGKAVNASAAKDDALLLPHVTKMSAMGDSDSTTAAGGVPNAAEVEAMRELLINLTEFNDELTDEATTAGGPAPAVTVPLPIRKGEANPQGARSGKKSLISQMVSGAETLFGPLFDDDKQSASGGGGGGFRRPPPPSAGRCAPSCFCCTPAPAYTSHASHHLIPHLTADCGRSRIGYMRVVYALTRAPSHDRFPVFPARARTRRGYSTAELRASGRGGRQF